MIVDTNTTELKQKWKVQHKFETDIINRLKRKQAIKILEQTNKHTSATLKCNAWPMSHPLHSFMGCLFCRHWRGGHEHYVVDHPSFETLLCNMHDVHFVSSSNLEVCWEPSSQTRNMQVQCSQEVGRSQLPWVVGHLLLGLLH